MSTCSVVPLSSSRVPLCAGVADRLCRFEGVHVRGLLVGRTRTATTPSRARATIAPPPMIRAARLARRGDGVGTLLCRYMTASSHRDGRARSPRIPAADPRNDHPAPRLRGEAVRTGRRPDRCSARPPSACPRSASSPRPETSTGWPGAGHRRGQERVARPRRRRARSASAPRSRCCASRRTRGSCRVHNGRRCAEPAVGEQRVRVGAEHDVGAVAGHPRRERLHLRRSGTSCPRRPSA